MASTSMPVKKLPAGRRCFVPGCKTGTVTKPKFKNSLFKAPANEILRTKWITLIKRTDKELNERCYVCSVHFEPHYIEYFRVHPAYRMLMYRNAPRLTPDAIPTIFPNRRRLKKKVKVPEKKRKAKDRSLILYHYQTRRKSSQQAELSNIEVSGNPQTSNLQVEPSRIGVSASPGTSNQQVEVSEEMEVLENAELRNLQTSSAEVSESAKASIQQVEVPKIEGSGSPRAINQNEKSNESPGASNRHKSKNGVPGSPAV